MNKHELKLNDLAIAALRESAKWCLFLSIVGFLFIGLMVIMGIFMTVVMSAMPDDVMMAGANETNAAALSVVSKMKSYFGLFYLLIAVLHFFPVYYLFKYATETKRALEAGTDTALANALVNLKSHHKFIGIATIIVISLYIIGIIGIFIFAASNAGAVVAA
ncbi:MAG: hypothetical protein V4535_08515 [Bacteroidota bacterium]